MAELQITLVESLQILTCLFSGIFAGSSLYALIVEVPSRKNLPSLSHWEQWRDSCISAHRVTSIVMVLAGIASIAVYCLDEKSEMRSLWVAQPVAAVFVTIFAAIVMRPEVKTLLTDDIVHKKGADWVREATERWARRFLSIVVVQVFTFVIVLFATVKS